MGAVARTRSDGLHESTGKLVPEGTTHEPQWSEWMPEGPVVIRQCQHPDCDVDEYGARP